MNIQTHDPLALVAQFEALQARLSPQSKRELARRIGRELAQSQRRRITQQKNPDGSSYEPRKRTLRTKKGRIRRKAMFLKLKTARLMKTKTHQHGVHIGFTGENAVIANVHQQGLRAKVVKERNYQAQYPQRELLGFSDDDIDLVETLVIEQLGI